MFFPIGDDNVQGGYKPLFSYTLILVNVLVFLFEFSLQQDAAEAMAYDKCFQDALTKEWVTEDGDKFKKQKMSISVADSYARKVYKKDPDYISEITSCDEIDNNYWAVNKIFDQAREVMNAMAKRIGKF